MFDVIIINMKAKLRRSLVVFLLVVSGLILFWSIWPLNANKRSIQLYPQDLTLPVEDGSQTFEMIIDGRLLTLEWPSKLRTGDSGNIRLGLELIEDSGITPPVPVRLDDKPDVEGQNGNIYDTHHIIVEAHLEMPDMPHVPTGQIYEGLLPGKPTFFSWRVRPEKKGVYAGTVWLHLNYVPKNGGEETRRVVSAQLLEIEAIELLSIGGSMGRVLGSVGVVVSLVVVLDDLFPLILKMFQKFSEK